MSSTSGFRLNPLERQAFQKSPGSFCPNAVRLLYNEFIQTLPPTLYPIMIGFLKPDKLELLLKDCLYYKLYYCSICRHLVRDNFRAYAFLNSYEGTLLAMLYNEMVVRDIEAIKDRCSGVPIAKVATLRPGNEAIELGAFISLLAFRVKFQDKRFSGA